MIWTASSSIGPRAKSVWASCGHGLGSAPRSAIRTGATVPFSNTTLRFRDVTSLAAGTQRRARARPGRTASGRDRRRSGDLTLFRSDHALFALSPLTMRIARMTSSEGRIKRPFRSRWTALFGTVSRSLGHPRARNLIGPKYSAAKHDAISRQSRRSAAGSALSGPNRMFFRMDCTHYHPERSVFVESWQTVPCGWQN